MESLHHAKQAAAGGIASTVSLAITYPLYRAVISTQSGAMSQKDHLLRRMMRLVEEKGPWSLYVGLGSALVATGLQSTVYYFWYSFFAALHRASSPLSHMKSALEAGWATVLMTNPLWVVNTRQITAAKSQQGMPQCSAVEIAMEIVREEGWRGLYSGVVAALVLCINPSLQFSSYVLYTRRWAHVAARLEHGSPHAFVLRKDHPLVIFIIAGLSKITSTVVSYPFQVIKTAMQQKQRGTAAQPAALQSPIASVPVAGVQSLTASNSAGAQQHAGCGCNAVLGSAQAPSGMGTGLQALWTLRAAVLDIHGEHGWRGFYLGLDAKLTQTALTAAILFVIRDAISKALERW